MNICWITVNPHTHAELVFLHLSTWINALFPGKIRKLMWIISLQELQATFFQQKSLWWPSTFRCPSFPDHSIIVILSPGKGFHFTEWLRLIVSCGSIWPKPNPAGAPSAGCPGTHPSSIWEFSRRGPHSLSGQLVSMLCHLNGAVVPGIQREPPMFQSHCRNSWNWAPLRRALLCPLHL